MAGVEAPVVLCPCGKPLHYKEPSSRTIVEKFIREHGATVVVVTKDGSWLVPRHFIALHGVKSIDLPVVAERYGFKKC